MKSAALPLIVLTGLAVCLGRFTVPGHGVSWPGTFEALAHIWVGVLLAVAFLTTGRNRWVAASVFELVMFLTR